MKPKEKKKWVVKTLVPDEVYTDRTELLEYFYQTALNTARRIPTSTVLLGKQRMGKTEIFKRVVNKLFFEQEPLEGKCSLPLLISIQCGSRWLRLLPMFEAVPALSV